MTTLSPAAPTAPAAAPSGAPPSRLAAMPVQRYRLLVLAILALGAALAAEGMQRLAAMRATWYLAQVRSHAVSPVSYGASLPSLHALAGGAGRVRAVVRVDSAGADGARLCALAGALGGDAGVVWITASPDAEACVRERVGGRVVRAAAAARTELGKARWIVIGGDGMALHSAHGVPSAAELRETAALLAPLPAEARP